jgi:hypothetical protein
VKSVNFKVILETFSRLEVLERWKCILTWRVFFLTFMNGFVFFSSLFDYLKQVIFSVMN